MNKVALVTGGARRIGRRLALALAREGYDIALHCGSSRELGRNTVAEIRDCGRRAELYGADLSREEEVLALLPRIVRRLGPPSVLVNNAALFLGDGSDGIDRNSWDLQMEVNLRAPVVLARRFAESLPETAEGLIVNLLDARVFHPTPNYLSYTISKTGLLAATQVMARALAPRIRVNGIAPGPVLPAPGMSEERFRGIVERTPLGRAPDPAEIAEALRFLLRAPSVTGEVLLVDGGQHLGATASSGIFVGRALRRD